MAAAVEMVALMARYEPHDKFYRKAREQGLKSRAAFKLEEIIERFKLVREGARVIDLGCAPGGWLVVLARAVGARGRVVGVDLAACQSSAPNVVTITGDVRDATIRATIAEKISAQADLVTSDLAPKLSGIKERDQALALELQMTALEFARAQLRPGGAMVAKFFMGEGFDEMKASFARTFDKVEIVRTRATRPGSSELYVVARNFRGRAG
jgi:23S rRNA (uridine2552-2'-O)-methyltransferase